MDTKKLILAIALSIGVIMVYQYFFMPQPQPVQQKKVAQVSKDVPVKENKTETITSPESKPQAEAETKTEKTEPADDLIGTDTKDVIVENSKFIAVFTPKGAALKSFKLKNFQDDLAFKDKKPLSETPYEFISDSVRESGNLPFFYSPFSDKPEIKQLASLNKQIFKYEKKETEGKTVLTFSIRTNGISSTKSFSISKDSYIITTDFSGSYNGKKLENIPVIFGPSIGNNADPSRVLQESRKIVGYSHIKDDMTDFIPGKINLQEFTPEKSDGKKYMRYSDTLGKFFDWAAFENTYFALFFKTEREDFVDIVLEKSEYLEKDKTKPSYKDFLYLIVNKPVSVFMGPKEASVLEEINTIFPNAHKTIDYGSLLAPIAKIILQGINFVYKTILNSWNYGWAIVIFTILLRILLFPLTYSSNVSMAKMQTIQPKMKAIQKKYKNKKDPEQRKALNEEMMKLYKAEKVNPAGGCLPMLLQMPILFAFFYLLRVSISVRHQPWLGWIEDLSLPDPYMILPILMALSMILLQKLSPSASGGPSDQQKGMKFMMMYGMPLFMLFIVKNMASGLTLYWFTSNILQIGQQYIINKKIHREKKQEISLQKANKRKKGVKNVK